MKNWIEAQAGSQHLVEMGSAPRGRRGAERTDEWPPLELVKEQTENVSLSRSEAKDGKGEVGSSSEDDEECDRNVPRWHEGLERKGNVQT